MKIVKRMNLLILLFTLSLGAEVVVETKSTEGVDDHSTPSPIVEVEIEANSSPKGIEEVVSSESTPKIEEVPVKKESQATAEEPNIKELVSKVQDAPDDQKRVLMNQLKMRLKKMNKESRKKVMKQLKNSFAKKSIENREHQKKHNGEAQHGSHQPKFRHLQLGSKDGHGGGSGVNSTPHQGSGHK